MTTPVRPIDHGTLTGYKIRACRCEHCTGAQTRYNARRARLIAYGQWQPFVDAAPVRDHVRAIQEQGLGWKRVAALAGVSPSTISKILYGDTGRGMAPSKRVRPETAAAILAVRADLDTLSVAVSIDAVGTQRRMQALAALGWSLSEQARRLGRTVANYAQILKRDRVSVRTARDVRALYAELSMMPPVAQWPGNGVIRARNEARRRGWLPPLAWDDDLIDLPQQELAVELERLVACMDEDELRACFTAYRRGERSPLIVAANAAYRRQCQELSA